MYKVIKYFTDKDDNRHPYEVGDTFPRKGLKVSEERLAELAGSDNLRGEPLIVFVEEEKKTPKAKKAPKK